MTAALSIARLDVLSDARTQVYLAAFAAAFSYGWLTQDEQRELPEMLRTRLDDLALRLALYHSLRDEPEGGR